MIYLKQYYNKYFLPYTDIPYEDVPATQRMELKESTSFAAWMLANHFKQCVVDMKKAIAKCGCTVDDVRKSTKTFAEVSNKINNRK